MHAIASNHSIRNNTVSFIRSITPSLLTLLNISTAKQTLDFNIEIRKRFAKLDHAEMGKFFSSA